MGCDEFEPENLADFLQRRQLHIPTQKTAGKQVHCDLYNFLLVYDEAQACTS